MSSANKNRHRRADKRDGHKKARQATRRVLENGEVPDRIQGVNYSTRVEQAPIPDDAVTGGPKPKKNGCKRNKYGPHVIEVWPSAPTFERVYDPEQGKFVRREVPYWRRSWHPPYRCEACGKGFYSFPKRNAVHKESGRRYAATFNWENEVKEDHFDLWNIRARLLGLACRCRTCNPD